MNVTWHVYRSYRLAVSTHRDRTSDPTGHEFAELAAFDTQRDAHDFADRSRQTTGWAPHGAYDLDVSDPIRMTAPGTR